MAESGMSFWKKIILTLACQKDFRRRASELGVYAFYALDVDSDLNLICQWDANTIIKWSTGTSNDDAIDSLENQQVWFVHLIDLRIIEFSK